MLDRFRCNIKALAMSDYTQDLELVVKTFVDNDFEIDDNGRCYIVNIIFTTDEDEPQEARVDLDGVVENLIECHNDLQGYQDLFSIAHEFSRQAERLREVAGRFEDRCADRPGQRHTVLVSDIDGVVTNWGPDTDELEYRD